jgi:hypothetical protein
MPERLIRVNGVRVSASFPFSGQVSGFAQLRDDPLNSTLGDSNPLGYVTSPDGMVLMDADHHVGMVRQKGPRCRVPFWRVGVFYHGVIGVLEKSEAYGSHAQIPPRLAHNCQNATRHTGPECTSYRICANQDSENNDTAWGGGPAEGMSNQVY